MAFETRDNSGALFRNDRRENDSQPEYRGDGMVNGEPVWIAAWVKESTKTGKEFFSISFKPKNGPRPSRDLDGDSIPF